MTVAILVVAAQYQRNAPHQLANVEQRTPRDSSDLREAIKARADLLTCSDAPWMTLARVDNGHCARASTMPRVDDACYLLTKEKVLGSVRSLECVGLKPRRSTPLTTLPKAQNPRALMRPRPGTAPRRTASSTSANLL